MAVAISLWMAWCIDLRWGEPPSTWHPVAWLGRAMTPLGHRLRGLCPWAACLGGALAWCLLAGGLGGAAWLLARALDDAPTWLALPVLALLLKPMFAWRMLRDEVAAVEVALASAAGQGLPAGRAQLARLVSRDVSALDEGDVREAAIETLAENLNDSLVAPLFWFVVAGLPGAVVYRFANTADAMWGYRGDWEWAGKWSARADDVLSWLPARLTAALLLPVWHGHRWKTLRREAGQTPSPNGGWPMGALALRLDVRLTKPGVYALNAGRPAPQSRHLALALRHASAAAWCAVLGAGLCLAVWPGPRGAGW